MKAPKCKLCGEPHWSHQPHQLTKAKASAPKRETLASPPTKARSPKKNAPAKHRGVKSLKG